VPDENRFPTETQQIANFLYGRAPGITCGIIAKNLWSKLWPLAQRHRNYSDRPDPTDTGRRLGRRSSSRWNTYTGTVALLAVLASHCTAINYGS
jgi:hypothetical protein